MQCNVSKKYSSQNFYSIFNFHSGRKFLYNSLDPNLTKKFQLFFLYSLNWVDFNFYHVQFEDIFLYLTSLSPGISFDTKVRTKVQKCNYI